MKNIVKKIISNDNGSVKRLLIAIAIYLLILFGFLLTSISCNAQSTFQKIYGTPPGMDIFDDFNVNDALQVTSDNGYVLAFSTVSRLIGIPVGVYRIILPKLNSDG